MNQDETRDVSGNREIASADANEVSQRLVWAIAQMVGDAMSADWTRQSLELAQSSAADETRMQPKDPAWDGLTFFSYPPVVRFRTTMEDRVPIIGVGSLTSRLEQGVQTWPYGYRRLPARTQLVDRLLYGGRRRRFSPGLFDHMDQLLDLSDPRSSRVGYNPRAHLDLLGNTKFEIFDIQPMEIDLTPFSFPLVRRERPRSPFSRRVSRTVRSLLGNTEPGGFRGLLDFPVSVKLSNFEEVANGDENGTIEGRS